MTINASVGSGQVRGEKFLQFVPYRFWIRRLAFPNNKGFPTHGEQALGVSLVPCAIPREFGLPVFGIALWNARKLAPVAVPETSIHEYDLLPGAEDDIGSSGQILAMQPKSITNGMRYPADNHFGSSIAPLDRCHDSSSLFRTSFHMHVPITETYCTNDD